MDTLLTFSLANIHWQEQWPGVTITQKSNVRAYTIEIVHAYFTMVCKYPDVACNT